MTATEPDETSIDSAVTDLGGGVWTIPVPIPDNPLGNTLVYVLESDRGPVLVDAGWDDPRSLAALTSGLTAMGTSLADVHGVIATHNHPDHHGLTYAVVEASGAWVAMHEADAAHVELINTSPRSRWLEHHLEVLRAAGAPQEALDALTSTRKASGVVSPRFRLATPDRNLVHGELADVAGRDVRIVWTPGHTPGHVCLFLEEGVGTGPDRAGRLLSGDHLLPGITPHIGLYDDTDEADPLGDFLASLAKVAAMPITEVLPAHQHIFTDAPTRVAEITALHEERLVALHARLAATPLTLWEIAVGMDWNRPWSELGVQNRQIALSEAAAHLRHLVKRGQAGAVSTDDPIRYGATA
ncbi:MBL fold metallo-hydrolase [Yinghuangia seranimata]|uniref:MBL fold metallo-hydrolase n=1 Tax=Yinghuangia seranimata TaxID=408067 RepID=UPI00248B28E6|nr:MBL fold metallo-hydrolase [Yinghuangia seranimata]MDI2128534.1 MBL fold metallo-hydrolase [Yinghuangia seranimata]